MPQGPNRSGKSRQAAPLRAIQSTINQYKIIDRIGEGGMGVVYLAEDTRLHRKVALKFVSNVSLNSTEAITRFHREARAAARLNHPNICTVHELGETEDKTYIVMEYVEGITLKERIEQGDILEEDIRKWFLQIVEGLYEAHEAGVIHRDVKPANIMITEKGLIKIMDFGIAKLVGIESDLTKANSTIGTVAYMSPEQARGENINRQTDIWSAGVILYELTTGKLPFVGAFREAVIYSLCYTEAPPPFSINPDISSDFEFIIQRCLQRELNKRYVSFSELREDMHPQKSSLEKAVHDIENSATSQLNQNLEGYSSEDNKIIQKSEGRFIGSYKIHKKIGDGGMGVVYLAMHTGKPYRKNVALKVLKRGMDTDEILSRFRSERQILAALNHPNISQLIDGGMTQDGRPYFVMNYIDQGKTIEKYCDENKLNVQERLDLFLTVCNAVQHAHQHLVIHRDLKPSNILVDKEGIVQLLDFGIAKIMNPGMFQHSVAITQTDIRLMTLEYASPEQVLGDAITTATDVYSLGVILYRLLTGCAPYDVTTQSSISAVKMICEVDPDRPSTMIRRMRSGYLREGRQGIAETEIRQAPTIPDRKLAQQLSGDLDNIILKALQKDPQRRYASIVQFAEDIDRYLNGLPVIARKDTIHYRVKKFIARNKAGVASVFVIILLLLSFLVTTLVQSERISKERDLAKLESQKVAEVVAFLTSVFEVSNPSESLGETITAKELLEKGEKRLNNELVDQPEIQAEMMRVIGNAYKGMGLYTQSKPLLEGSVATLRTLYQEPDSNLALSLTDLGELLVHLGQYEEAGITFEEAIEIQQMLFEKGSIQLARTINNLALVRFHQGDPMVADSLFRVALDIRKIMVGEYSTAVISSLTSIGAVLNYMKKYDESEKILREALETSKEVFEENHPTVTSIKNNLAQALFNQEKFEEAGPLFIEVLATRRELYGDYHNSVAVSLNNLAQFLRKTGDLVEAERFAQEGIEVLRHIHQADHPLIGRGLRGLGRIQLESGAYKSAEASWLESYRLLSASLPEDHNLVLQIRSDLVEIYEAMSKPLEAERYRAE